MSKNKTSIKVSVIGAGFVGSTVAYTLMMRGVASHIVLVDTNADKAEGEAMDISHGATFAKASTVISGDYTATTNSDIVIVTAGTSQKPGEARTDMVVRNAAIMRDVAGQVAHHSPNAILLIISNPVDVMAYVAQQVTGFAPERVIGSGTVLDSSRVRFLLEKQTGIDARDIHAYVFGEHGDSEFVPWSLVNIAGMGIEEATCSLNYCLAPEVLQNIADETRNAAYEIIQRKGATYYGIAMSASRIVEAIVRDEKAIMTVSSLLNGQYDINDVYLSIPAVLGENGVERLLTPKMTDDEMAKLHNSANVLKEVRSRIEG